jgi:hypothetical protein
MSYPYIGKIETYNDELEGKNIDTLTIGLQDTLKRQIIKLDFIYKYSNETSESKVDLYINIGRAENLDNKILIKADEEIIEKRINNMETESKTGTSTAGKDGEITLTSHWTQVNGSIDLELELIKKIIKSDESIIQLYISSKPVKFIITSEVINTLKQFYKMN